MGRMILAYLHDDGTIDVPDDAVTITADGRVRRRRRKLAPLSEAQQRRALWERVNGNRQPPSPTVGRS